MDEATLVSPPDRKFGSASFSDDERLARIDETLLDHREQLARIGALLEAQAKTADRMRDDFADTVRLIVNGQFRELRAKAEAVVERVAKVETVVERLKDAEGETRPFRRVGYAILTAVLIAVVSAVIATVIVAPPRAPVDLNRTLKGQMP